MSPFAAQLNDDASQIDCVGRTAALIVDNVQFLARIGQCENRLWKALSADPKHPRRPQNADFGEYLSYRYLSSGFRLPVATLRCKRVINLIRAVLGPIKYVIGAEKNHSSVDLSGCSNHVDCTARGHVER